MRNLLRRLLVLPMLVVLGVAEAATQQAPQAVTGRVVSAETLEPLSGVLVSVDGASTAVLTGPDGRFSIAAPGDATLVFSMLGYTRLEEPVANRSEISVSLQSTALVLDEVVAVGYGQQTRATVSGSVSAVTSEEIETTTFNTTSDALQGLVQGVSIRLMTSNASSHAAGQASTVGTGDQIQGEAQDGRPGASSTIQIRNMGEPLYVIDGVPSDAMTFNHLNPSDIENISILKDASAAVYGFRAANGVVLVTTKRGSTEQAPTVTITGAYGWQNLTDYHFMRPATAYQFLFSRVDSEQNLGQPTRSLTREELDLWRIEAPGYESTNHYPLVFDNPNAPQYNLNASVSGGMENAQYYLSVGNVRQEYNLQDFVWGRTNLQANLQISLSERLTLGTELRAQQQNRDEVALVGDQDAIRTAIHGNNSNWPHEKPWIGPNNDLINAEVRYLSRQVSVQSRDVSGYSEDIRREGTGNFWAEYRFPFGTTLRGTYSLNADIRDFDLVRRSWDAYCHDEATDTYYVCYNSGDRARQHLKHKRDEVFGNVTLSHSENLGMHSLAGAAFLEMEGSEFNQTHLIGQSPTNYTHIIDQTSVTEIGNNWSVSRRASVGGRVDYDYDEKYLVTALGRYDGSYLYAPGQRWGFFPGLSVGWRITQEPFLRDRWTWLNELKLRASWGQTGREMGIAPWGFLGGATYGDETSVFDGRVVQGTQPRGLPVTNLSWVRSTSRNVGLDLMALDGRLYTEVDFFERELSGLPAARSDVLLPSELGYGLPNENLNADVTKGFEAAVTWADNVGRVSYSLSPNITIARTMGKERYRERYANSWDEYQSKQSGRWLEASNLGGYDAANWGYEVIGHFQSVEEIESYPVVIESEGNERLLPGDFIFRDVNGDGIINNLDMRPISFSINQTPIIAFGAGTSLSFMGFTLTANFAGGAGYAHERCCETRVLSQGGHNHTQYAMDRWHREDPWNPQSEWIPGRYPPLKIGQPQVSYNPRSDFFRKNVKFLRVRRVELAYDVPDRIPGNFGMSGLRVYTNLSNPFAFHNLRHYSVDPEMTYNAGHVYPTIRLLNVGFSANLGGGSQSN